MQIERDCPHCSGTILIELAWEPHRPAGRWSPAEGGYWYAEEWNHFEIDEWGNCSEACSASDAALEAIAQDAASDYEPPSRDDWADARADWQEGYYS